MHRIDGPSATPGNLFTEGSPAGGVPATVVSGDWLNDVQEELMTLLTTAGIAPVKGVRNQVYLALQQLFVSSDLAGSPNYQFLPGDKLLQFGSVTSSGTGYQDLTFPIAWPAAMRAIVGVVRGSGSVLLGALFNHSGLTTTKIPFAVVNSANAFIGASIYYIAVGE